MKKYQSLCIYGGILALAYYILPMAIADTGSAMFMMLGALPILTLVASYCYGVSKHHTWIFPFLVMGLFIPVIYIYLNSTAFVYIFIYGALSCIGYGVAQLFTKKNKKNYT